ncbi:TlpA family protein disulfide reductase [Mucilaginibacter limnophilus]|uniref:TlpA family protein disulfide reductase n=1 Tax=Mucilaginibacter limnophilus TaxID=1932778 RepID=A0A437MRX0_9SPHI|nr:TlpA disulfide reductase family protein [Mucilaginibacter limnophilus]RVU00398.1 TlpA family protein disulfide reductase [Mucilaginibacter limnophilus]
MIKPDKVWCEWKSAKEVLNTLINSKKPIVQQEDSIVNDAICYNFLVKISDTIIINSHNYTHYQLLIDKHTLLPLKIKQTAEGDAEKGGYNLGRVQMYQENIFSNYVINKSISQEEVRFKKQGFALQITAMLSNGEQIPELKVISLDGKNVMAQEFKNKVMLIELGATACPANTLANPMLNRLQNKYAKNGVLIFGIYCDDTAQQITKYRQSNNLAFPIYIAEKRQKRALKTVGTPGFYLVDSTGKILLSSNGYNDNLEADISQQIDKQLAQ